ncbi:MAG: RuBisCO large subunit C-terminal-like domain-containing protein [Candidatus Sumerlaeota bacterium]|nr:RuBisCO large subunit C-terminal-like domain-containing protein [Candidatus Sumerlaeota bacterium]
MAADERFSVIYRVAGDEKEAYARARDICFEQTVEFPEDLVPEGFIRDHVVGRIESFHRADERGFLATISFPVEAAAGELPQLLNVIYGNISIKPGIRVESFALPPSLLNAFKGPRFGRQGLRDLLGIPKRPLLHTALKPMGLTPRALADLAWQFALGGIDIIKDDHGLTNQRYAPFEERVQLCAEAVAKANRETGQNCIYVANVTAPAGEAPTRARFAKSAGARGLIISAALTGLDAARALADDDSIALPLFGHPAFQGVYVIHPDAGISHYCLFGQISRLAGMDAVVYPNFGGRFSFSRDECQSIARGSGKEMGHIKPAFPSPGGGMSLGRVPEMFEVYGCDVIFLIGGGLFKHGPNLIENCRYFRGVVEKFV